MFIIAISIITVIFALRDKMLVAFFKFFPFWEPIYRQDGWFSFITSYRNVRFKESYNQIRVTWKFPNYVFGGTTIPTQRTEWGFIDLYLFFGAIGLLVYIIWFVKIFRDLDIKDVFLLLLVPMIAFFVGGFFVNINIMMFYVLLVVFFKDKKQNTFSN
ncbi:hypothetical protein [Lacinutrix mariniflava]|uniref:hypothetical protein n=1 Tax=Lacinutrix mariniflava TaxID=342955 RepID=UPI00128F91CA|nr:hypothetical protein [Lacinutrix mariniflava]